MEINYKRRAHQGDFFKWTAAKAKTKQNYASREYNWNDETAISINLTGFRPLVYKVAYRASQFEPVITSKLTKGAPVLNLYWLWIAGE